MSTNAKNLDEITLAVAKTFGEICQFLPSHRKWCSCYSCNLRVTEAILIKLPKDVAAIVPVNIFESELAYSYPLWNASMPNKGHFANFAQISCHGNIP